MYGGLFVMRATLRLFYMSEEHPLEYATAYNFGKKRFW